MLSGRHHSSRRLLVTGSSGFLGLSLVQAFAQQPDLEVLACDLWPAERSSELDAVSFAPLDVRDRSACLRLLQEFRPTHVLHAAAVTVGDECLMRSVNIDGTRNILDASIAAGTVQRCVLLSSSGVYGSPQDASPCDEEHALDTRSSYAYSKRAAELCLPAREAASGVEMLAVRVGPCYGAQERSGEFRPRVSLFATLRDALVHGDSVRVHGQSFVRDWTHVGDIYRALDALLFAYRLKHRVYNLSSGIGVDVRDVFAAFVELGLRMQWVDDPSEATILLRAEDSRKPMIIERLRSDTGFSPAYTLRQGVRTLLEARHLALPPLVGHRT